MRSSMTLALALSWALAASAAWGGNAQPPQCMMKCAKKVKPCTEKCASDNPQCNQGCLQDFKSCQEGCPKAERDKYTPKRPKEHPEETE